MMVVMRSSGSSGRRLISALPRRLRIRHRQPPDLFVVDLALEEKNSTGVWVLATNSLATKSSSRVCMPGAALAAAALRAIGRQRHALDVAGVARPSPPCPRAGSGLRPRPRPPVRGFRSGAGWRTRLEAAEFVLDDRLHAHARPQDFEVVRDLLAELLSSSAISRGRARSAAADAVREWPWPAPPTAAKVPSSAHLVARIGDQVDQRRSCPWPASRAPSGRRARVPGSFDVRISAMISSILATATARPTRTCARSRALLSRYLVRRVTTSSRNARNSAYVLELHELRAAAGERHAVDGESRLQRRETIELVEHHVGHRVALELRRPPACRAGRIRRGCRRFLRSSFRGPVRRFSRPSSPCSPGREFR